MLVARDAERLEAARESLKRVEAGSHLAISTDISDIEQVSQMAAQVLEQAGFPDLLINNAGVAHPGYVHELGMDIYHWMMDVNYFGTVNVLKLLVPQMKSRRSGHIVNISSMAAWSSYPYVAYKTSKAGVIALTEQTAQANARYGIRANVILPGLMNTPMAIEARVAAGTPRADVIAQRDARVPLGGKMGSGWDVANAAAFLASDKAGFITGVALPVDGGASVRRG